MRNIKYSDVMELGFVEQFEHDPVFFNEYGFQYTIITYDLTDYIFLDWEKHTGVCRLYRVNEDGDIKGKILIDDLESLKEVIDFFKDN